MRRLLGRRGNVRVALPSARVRALDLPSYYKPSSRSPSCHGKISTAPIRRRSAPRYSTTAAVPLAKIIGEAIEAAEIPCADVALGFGLNGDSLALHVEDKNPLRRHASVR